MDVSSCFQKLLRHGSAISLIALGALIQGLMNHLVGGLVPTVVLLAAVAVIVWYTSRDLSLECALGDREDMREYRHAADALRSSEATLRRALDTARMVHWHLDLETGELALSDSAREVLGFTPESIDALGQDPGSIHPEDEPAYHAQQAETMEQCTSYMTEFRFSRPDGRTVWLEDRGHVECDPMGNPVALTGVMMDITERKRMEAALRDSEERLQLAAAGARVGLWFYDLTDQGMEWTPMCRELFGVGPDQELSYELFFGLVHPDDREPLHSLVQTSIALRQEYKAEFRVLWPDGAVRWMAGQGQATYSADGTPLRMAGMNIDITERKRAELHNALLADLGAYLHEGKSPDELLRGVAALVGSRLGVARAAFCDIDVEHGSVTVQHEYVDGVHSVAGVYRLASFGPVVDELSQGKTVWTRDVRTDARTAPYWPAFERLGILSCLAVPLIREGRWITTLVLQNRVPQNWPADEVELVRIVAERTWLAVENSRLTAETRRNEEVLRLMAESMPDILYMSRTDGSAEYLSPRFYQYTGLSPERVVDAGWAAAVHPDDRPRLQAEWKAQSAAVRAWESEFRMRTSHGSYRWYLTRCLPMLDATGAVIRWVGTSTDIDDRKRAEEALRQADQRKDEFLATLAHELRNPLAPLRNAVHLLSIHGATNDTARWARDVIARQIEQMTRLVDDLLEISRITQGKIELRTQRVDVRAAAASALEISRPLIEASGHQLTVELPPEPLLVDADLTRLAQILANLLNNAAKYTEDGGHITLSAWRDGAEVVLAVRDTGMGIPADKLHDIFEPFVQVKLARARAQGGLGLGLTLVRTLAAMHGGTVRVTSAGPGQGSEFTVRLPLVADAVMMAAPAASPEPPAVTAAPVQRILVVDDNSDSAQSLAMLLEAWGHEVCIAYSGHQALEQARVFVPDVVLLDIGLPDVSGYEVARMLRQEPRLGHVVLVAQTGWGQDEDRRRSEAAGFDHHLVKPVAPESLSALVAQLARKRAPLG